MAEAATDAELVERWRALSNWGRWGADDELGTLNFITPDVRRRAAQLVTDGVSVSCAVRTTGGPEPLAFQRYMMLSGQGWHDPDRIQPPGRRIGNGIDLHEGFKEYVGLTVHSLQLTHLDALAHVAWDGRLYNDHPAASVTSAAGATVLAVTAMRSGVVSRGLLYDIPRERGVDQLAAGDGVRPEELEAFEQAHGFEAGRGDIVLLRTGFPQQRPIALSEIEGLAGYHPDCVDWFAEREVAMIGSDVAQDPMPAMMGIGAPVHAVGIAMLGMPMLDNADLEELAAACAERGRYEFLFTIAPLVLEGCTGSPVNPIAIL